MPRDRTVLLVGTLNIDPKELERMRDPIKHGILYNKKQQWTRTHAATLEEQFCWEERQFGIYVSEYHLSICNYLIYKT